MTMAMAGQSPLPAFSGAGAACPKCGAQLGTKWHVMWTGSPWPCRLKRAQVGQHLCRLCPVCGWGRVEATADAS